jgi:hypothetical protein
MIAAVKPAGVANFNIHFKNGQYNRGRAYTTGCSYGPTVGPLVVVALRPNMTRDQFPYCVAQGRGYLGIETYSMKEIALEITAHELRHLWQRKVPRGWRVWGAKGQYSERDADAYALRMLRRYRRGELGC